MRRRKQNIFLNLLLGSGAYLLYSMRHQLGDIEDLRDRAIESYETASRRIGRATAALRGQDRNAVSTATALLMGGVGVGAGAYLLYSMRDRLGNIEDLTDKLRESYDTASRRIGRASDALRGRNHRAVGTATALLMGAGAGVGIGMLIAPSSGEKTRADISEKIKQRRERREKVRDRSSREPQGASGTYGQ